MAWTSQPQPEGTDGAAGRRWRAILGALVAVRLAIPLLTLAFSGRQLPGLPAYSYQPLNGDSFGYYAAAREFISSVGHVRMSLLLLATALVGVSVGVGVWLWRRSPEHRAAAVLVPAGALSLAVTLPIHEMHPPGAGVFGWSLLWSIPMAPIRVVGIDPTPDVAFVLGLALTLVAIAVAVIATAYVGLYATGRRSVGLVAAALLTAWPLLSRPLSGASAWENGTWLVDTGLHLYTEPLSTALVVTSIALVLRPTTRRFGLAGAGLAIGYATLVKLTNGILGPVFVVLVALRHGPRRAVAYAVGFVLVLPPVVAYWPKGYIGTFDGATAPTSRPWAVSYAGDSWMQSFLFTPRLLLILAPLLVVGCFVIRGRWVLAAVLLPIIVTAVTYSFYYATADHPRFLYVALPFVFVLEAAGAISIVEAVQARSRRLRQVRVL